MTEERSLILVLKCPDRRGIVAVVSAFLAARGFSIVESNQFKDIQDDTFYMRVEAVAEAGVSFSIDVLHAEFAFVATEFSMTWELSPRATRPRVLLAVSRIGHCLFDLLHRWRSGLLPIDVVGVMSNHNDLRSFVEWNEVPFHHFPVERATRCAQEAQVLNLFRETRADLLVLARYMQILSPGMCAALEGRCINIHHSFLPSFKGAKPYHQAHARGVKIIGATAHYVTTDLDEGPIIEQSVERVTHDHTPQQLVAIGRDIECRVLARAVAWHIERRVLLNGQKTVVFA